MPRVLHLAHTARADHQPRARRHACFHREVGSLATRVQRHADIELLVAPLVDVAAARAQVGEAGGRGASVGDAECVRVHVDDRHSRAREQRGKR